MYNWSFGGMQYFKLKNLGFNPKTFFRQICTNHWIEHGCLNKKNQKVWIRKRTGKCMKMLYFSSEKSNFRKGNGGNTTRSQTVIEDFRGRSADCQGSQKIGKDHILGVTYLWVIFTRFPPLPCQDPPMGRKQVVCLRVCVCVCVRVLVCVNARSISLYREPNDRRNKLRVCINYN